MIQGRVVAALVAAGCVGAAGCGGGGGGAGAAPAGGSNTATLRATWQTAWVVSADTHVFVNGVEIGQVSRAETKSLVFVPRPGTNTIELKYEYVFQKSHWQGEFRAHPGELFAIAFDPTTDGGFNILSRSDGGGAADPAPVNLQLSGAARKVLASEEVVTSVVGVEQQVTRAHTIDQSLDFSQATSSGVTAGLNMGVLSGSVTGQVESRRGVQLRTSQTITRGVTISGAVGGRRYKLVWYDLVRDGTVDVPTAGGNRTLPFRYKEDAVLEVVADN